MLATVTSEAAECLGYADQGAGRPAAGATVIGSIVPASDGIVLVGADGTKRPLPELGYEHTF